jgi:hypothetical protein
MKTRVTLDLMREVELYALRFTCDDCAFFTGARCANGWPGGERRRELREGDQVVFCKEFESGP